jgi:ribulose-phosphate 3-epimerase
VRNLKVAASIISVNIGRMTDEIRRINNSGIDIIHVDIMDGHYVPQITFGEEMTKLICNTTSLPVDVHLAISNPDESIDRYTSLKLRTVYVHPETSYMPLRLLRKIAQCGITPGIAINPGSSLDAIESIVECLSLKCNILLMTVEPGFGGQAILAKRLEVISRLRNITNGEIWVDGGIDAESAYRVRSIGGDGVVSGTFLLNATSISSRVKMLKGIQNEESSL